MSRQRQGADLKTRTHRAENMSDLELQELRADIKVREDYRVFVFILIDWLGANKQNTNFLLQLETKVSSHDMCYLRHHCGFEVHCQISRIS